MSNTNLIQMIKNGVNPQQLILQMLQQKMGGTPLGNNLIQMVQSGNTSGIEQVARNLLAARGIDFDKEFAAFKNQLGL